IRRAIRHGYKLGQKQPFFYRLVEDLDKAMGDAYPELRKNKARVAEVLKQEEERFAETLENGMAVLESALASGENLLDGDTVFRLYDTFGFPVDLTADIGRARGVQVRDGRRPRVLGRQDRVPRLRHAQGAGAGGRSVYGRRGGEIAQGG